MVRPAAIVGAVHVVSVIDDLAFGGGDVRLLAFASSIDRRLIKHTVVTIQRASASNAASTAMRRHFATAGIDIVDLGVVNARESTTGDRWRYLRSAWRVLQKTYRLKNALQHLKADVVDSHLPTASLISVVAASLLRRPVTVTLYGRLTTQREPDHSSLQRAAWWLVRQVTFSLASVIITDSTARGSDFKRAMWLVRPVAIIPNGVTTPRSDKTRDEMRRVLGIPGDPTRRVIGQVSALVPFKGIMVLLEAAVHVLRERPGTFFLIVGYERTLDSYKRRLEERAAELGIAASVHIVSYPGPIGDAWKAIDIHVHASLLDSLPNAIMESMSLAMPAVVTSVGGTPDMVEHGQTGLVVPPNDAKHLADALLRLLNNPDEALAFGRAAYRRYCERYQTEIMTRSLERLFIDLAVPTAHPSGNGRDG